MQGIRESSVCKKREFKNSLQNYLLLIIFSKIGIRILLTGYLFIGWTFSRQQGTPTPSQTLAISMRFYQILIHRIETK